LEIKQLTLSDDAIKLLLKLLELNMKSLSFTLEHNFSPEFAGFAGRVPNRSEIILAQQLQLTCQLKEQLETIK
jgi:hypothetical protein